MKNLIKTYLLSVFAIMTLFTVSAVAADKTVSEQAKAEYADFKEDMSDKIDDLDKKINELQSTMKSKAKDSKKVAKEQVEKIKEMRAKLAAKMDALGRNSKESFKDAKVAVENSYDDLKKEVDKTLN